MASVKPAGYKLATYKSAEGPRAGLIVGEDVFDVAKLTGKPAYATVLGILADWKAAEGALRKAAAARGQKPGQAAAAEKGQVAGADPGQRRRSIAPAPITPITPRPWRRGRAVRRRPIRTSQGLKPFHFLKAPGTIVGLGHADQDFPLRQGHGLGNRACRRHRPAGQGRAEGESAQLCRRLYGLQRPFGARPRPSRRGGADLAVQDGLDSSIRRSRGHARSDRGSCRQAISPIRKISG